MSDLLRPLSTSEILDGAFTLYRRHFGVLLAVGLAVHALPALTALVAPWLAGILVWLLGPFYDGALIWLSAELIRANRPTASAALRVGLFCYVPLAVLTVAYALVVGLAFTAAAIPVALGAAVFAPLGLLLLPAAMAGIAWLLVSLFAWRQVVVLERNWNFLERSFRLARGGRWSVLWVALLGLLLVALAGAPLGVGAVLTGGLENLGSYTPTLGMSLLQFAVAIVTRPFTHLLFTLLYFSRRIRVEGYDVERSVEQLERALADEA